MAKTESVEALLNPSLRVSRPVAACARCRSAKIKCDGKLPACSACERSGKSSSCTSANDEFARGKERSYVAALEAAAQRLQRRLDNAKAQSAGHNAISASALRPGLPPTRKISGSRRKEASDVDELVSDFGFLTVNATSRDFHGFTATMSFAKLLLSAATRKELPPLENRALPPRFSVMPMINHYLENIYVLFPFFSETELMSALSRIYHENSSAPSSVSPLDVWNVRLILAVAYASSSQERGDENDETALQHVAAARGLANYVLHPGSISGLQALLLLVQYALVDPAHFDSWYLVGMASRLMVDLGLHCEPPPETKISKDTLDLRRRIFHCTYALDRLVSMSLDRAFSFTDDSAPDVPLPEPSPDPSSQLFLRSTKPSLYLFDIRRVQSAFYQTTRWSSRSQWPLATAATYSSSVSNDIHAWYSTIPTTLSQRHLMLFNLERLYSQILVVSPNPKVPATSMTDLNKELVFEYSAQYAELLQPITQDVAWHAYLTYADICRAKYVGQKFVEVMWSDFDRLVGKSSRAIQGDPPLSRNVPLDNSQRATICLRRIIKILDYAHHRWSMAEMREKFEQESAVLFSRLKSRQSEANSMQYTNTASAPSNSSIGYGNPGGNHYSLYPYNAAPFPSRPSPSAMNQDPRVHSDDQPGRMLTPPQGSLPRRSYEFFGGPNRE